MWLVMLRGAHLLRRVPAPQGLSCPGPEVHSNLSVPKQSRKTARIVATIMPFGDMEEEAGGEGSAEDGECLGDQTGFSNKNQNHSSLKREGGPWRPLGSLLKHQSPGPMGRRHLLKDPGAFHLTVCSAKRPSARACQFLAAQALTFKEGWETFCH